MTYRSGPAPLWQPYGIILVKSDVSSVHSAARYGSGTGKIAEKEQNVSSVL